MITESTPATGSNLHTNLPATPDQAAKIRAAVEIGNERSLTDYILTSALTMADQRIMELTRFTHDKSTYDAFLQALEEPPRDLPRMRRLLSESTVRPYREYSKALPAIQTYQSYCSLGWRLVKMSTGKAWVLLC